MSFQLQNTISVRLNTNDFPVVSGRWSDLMVVSWCNMILKQKMHVNPN
jgi:hypothetical protein